MDSLQAADELKLSRYYVNELIRMGKLKAVKIWKTGQLRAVWEIDESSIEHYRNNRPKVGRPRKSYHDKTNLDQGLISVRALDKTEMEAAQET